MEHHKFSYESMGTHWEISIWDKIDDTKFFVLQSFIIKISQDFDNTYSRFKKDSLVWKIAENPGLHEVPEELVTMLKKYFDMYELSERKLNPLIGFTISDLGYDADYSLTPKENIRLVPDLVQALEIIDDTHIITNQSVLIDLGALGKGYFVDLIWKYLHEQGIKRFLVNGSGDIRYEGKEPIQIGLEHPTDKTKIIGKIEMPKGSMCASGTDRRKWDKYNHVIDPIEMRSADEIIATWVMSENAAHADALATCLFFVPPENFKNYQFEYLIVNKDLRVKKSDGFIAELY